MLNNLTIENPQERIAPFREGFLIHDGSETVTVNNTIIKFWGSLSEDKGQIEKHLSPNCNPSDDVVQTVDITHNYWTMPYNPTQDRFVTFYTEFDQDYYRRMIVNYSYNLHENILDNIYGLNLAYCTQNTEIWMTNNQFYNVSCLQGAAYAVVSDKFIIENDLYADSTDFGFDTYAIMDTNEVIIKNVTTRNVNATGSSSEYYFYLRMNNGGNVTVDGLYFENSNVGQQRGLFVQGNMNTFIMTNLNFLNVLVGTGNTLINTGAFNKLEIYNTTFTNVQNETPNDENNIMITVNKINLGNAQNCIIKNATIENSEIGFLLFSSITGTASQTVTFSIEDINYQNCYFVNQKNLIEFKQMESQQDISFVFDNNMFNNVTFVKRGNLFLLQHQILNPVVLQNSKFTEVTSGTIYLESANKQSSNFSTRVMISNVTFASIDTNFVSLISVNEGSIIEIEDSSFSGVT